MAGVADSQSAKTTESGDPRGFDAGKKVTGRKRHIVTCADGLPLAAPVFSASIQDRNGAPALPASERYRFPRLRRIFTDGAREGPDGTRMRFRAIWTARGGKRAGLRLYAHSDIDHARLFAMLAEHGSNFLMTYDAAREIVALVRRHDFHAVRLSMKNSHHKRLPELVITPEPLFV